MSYNEFQLTWQHCDDEARGGELCKGAECTGWFLDQCDCYHACSCQAERKQPHPDYNMSADEYEESLR